MKNFDEMTMNELREMHDAMKEIMKNVEYANSEIIAWHDYYAEEHKGAFLEWDVNDIHSNAKYYETSGKVVAITCIRKSWKESYDTIMRLYSHL